ncbi:F0F1 ATP synthase subunit delta [Methylocella tundrae]|nr:F0F1 ATP synthase subunit delta [Methylocella tundrae]
MAKQETLVSGMAGRYAQALFDLAHETSTTDEVAADLATFAGLLAESEDLRDFVRSPVFSAEEQVKVLTALLDRASIGGTTAKFLKLVAAKRRLFAINDMIRDFNVLYDHARGLSRASVTVAEPLKDEHVEALKSALAAIAGSDRVEVSVKVDPTIIGGLIVQLGSRMVDGSLKTKLNSIRARMKEVG